MIVARAALATALLALTLFGCGQRPSPPTTLDEGLARRALAEALEAWKAGRPHAEPTATGTPLTVADEDWLTGATLVDYHVLPGEQVIGTRLNCPVALVIDRPSGPRVEKRVVYAVGTDPKPSVIRQD